MSNKIFLLLALSIGGIYLLKSHGEIVDVSNFHIKAYNYQYKIRVGRFARFLPKTIETGFCTMEKIDNKDKFFTLKTIIPYYPEEIERNKDLYYESSEFPLKVAALEAIARGDGSMDTYTSVKLDETGKNLIVTTKFWDLKD